MQDMEMSSKWVKKSPPYDTWRVEPLAVLRSPLISHFRLVLRRCVVAGVFSSAAVAGVTNDPTVPPPEWLALQPIIASKATTSIEPPMEIQLVLIGRTRKFAMIDGQIVKAGDVYKGSKVSAISADQVTMDDAVKSLSMTPDVTKKTALRVYSQNKKVVVTKVNSEAPKVLGTNK